MLTHFRATPRISKSQRCTHRISTGDGPYYQPCPSCPSESSKDPMKYRQHDIRGDTTERDGGNGVFITSQRYNNHCVAVDAVMSPVCGTTEDMCDHISSMPRPLQLRTCADYINTCTAPFHSLPIYSWDFFVVMIISLPHHNVPQFQLDISTDCLNSSLV
ncbi:hypothetical protein J6590_053188 [Homalodisca vitripennis]|nr:hypothetical protein J6590_053188 [Homalodisca vitripennis]